MMMMMMMMDHDMEASSRPPQELKERLFDVIDKDGDDLLNKAATQTNPGVPKQ